MRVISGSARGRRLEAPKDYSTRPTNDMVKEAMFNIIQVKVPEARVLDLFSCTGQLGIEALSRGAEFCVFVDESRDMISLTERNIKHTGFTEQAKTVRSDAVGFLSRADSFDIIFIDPPYESNMLDKTLEKIIEFDILREHGIIICESRAERELPEPRAPYKKDREYRYGKIKLTLYSRQAAAMPEDANNPPEEPYEKGINNA